MFQTFFCLAGLGIRIPKTVVDGNLKTFNESNSCPVLPKVLLVFVKLS